jgi:peptidoglycan/LPS O-acetylase OafA/YrhL
LRAFAVVVVILDHLFAWPAGGFVGVDVFFVISGFLITAHLLGEGEQRGTISVSTFYRKRMRRLLPAAMATLATTAIVAYALFNTTRWLATALDTFFAAVFLSNWRFAFVGSDYFQADGPVSPLRHFWSLSVEEQFYVIWPAILIVAFAVSRRLQGGALPKRTVALPYIVAILIASLAWSIYETASSPTVAYFSTFSRAWELGVGALLAVVAGHLGKLSVASRTVLAWLGIAAMISSLFVISPTSEFPFPLALLPVVGAAAYLAAGTGGNARGLQPVNNIVPVYIGNISYSLYLWHFPVIIFYQSYFGIESARDYALCLLWIGVLSAGSFHLIEKPVLESQWLLKSGADRAWTSWPRLVRRSRRRSEKSGAETALALTGLGLVACISLTLIETQNLAAEDFSVLAAASAPTTRTSGAGDPVLAPPLGPAGRVVRDNINTALAATAYPDNLDPSIDEALANVWVPSGFAGCGDLVQTRPCLFGNEFAPRSVFILGDSVAMPWAIGLLNTFATDQWKMQIRAMHGCPFVDVSPKRDAAFEEACATRKQEVVQEINEKRPDLLLIINTAVMPILADTNRSATPKEWGVGTESLLRAIAPSGSKAVVLSPPPADKDVKECYSSTSSPARCIGHVTTKYLDNVRWVSEAVAAVPGVSFLDSRYLFCSESGACPAFAGGMAIRSDRTHPTAEYIRAIQPAFVEMITAVGGM